MADIENDEDRWLAVIGRSLAFLSLHAAELRGKDLGEQAEFLKGLGLTRHEIAPMIGSTPASLEVLLRNRRNKGKGGKRGGKKRSKK